MFGFYQGMKNGNYIRGKESGPTESESANQVLDPEQGISAKCIATDTQGITQLVCPCGMNQVR